MIELPASPAIASICDYEGGVRLLDWYNYHGISRATAYVLLRATGIKLANRRIKEINKSVPYLTNNQLITMEEVLAKYRKNQLIGNLPVRTQPNRATISPRLRVDILVRDNYTCQMCGIGKKDGAILEIDHIYPASKGGTNNSENLQVLCRECNKGKGDRIMPNQV